jgi:hypothetical protein
LKAIYAIGLIILLALSVAELPLTVKANWSPGMPYIGVHSPFYNTVYYTNQPLVNITIEEIHDTGKSREAYYSLDGQKNVSIPLVLTGISNGAPYVSTFKGTTVLPKLSNGTHQIQFFAHFYGGEWGASDLITFTVVASDYIFLPLYIAVILVAALLAAYIFFIRKKHLTSARALSIKYLVVGVAIVIIASSLTFLAVNDVFNFGSDAFRTQVKFATAPSPEESQVGYFYKESYVNNALYAINLINNSTKPVYDVVMEYNIWLQYNNGTSSIVDFKAPKIDSIAANNSLYTTSIPSATKLFHMPPDCTFIKATIKDIYGYV